MAPMGRIRQEMGDLGDRGSFLVLRPARPRDTRTGRGALGPRVQGRYRARRREILARSSQGLRGHAHTSAT